jgi:uncharacterized protein (TIGR03000 family)
LRKELEAEKARQEAAASKATGAIDRGAAPATLAVTLPADARLTFDGKPTTSTGGRREFVTPDLSPGRAYSYTLEAEVLRDGKPVTMEQRVEVHASQEAEVTFSLPVLAIIDQRR